MNKDTLHAVIHLGQLMRLLTPIANFDKPFEKRLARLRGWLDEQVVLLALDSKSPAGRAAAARVAEMTTVLTADLIKSVDIPELFKRAKDSREVATRHVSKCSALRVFSDWVLDRAEKILAPKLNLSTEDFPEAERARVLRAFNSAVKNSSWLATVLKLEVGMTVATEASAYLVAQYSSGQGRAALDATLAHLCSPKTTAARKRSRQSAVKAEELFVTQVSLDTQRLLAQPDIAALVDVHHGAATEPTPSLSQLLEVASKPVAIGPDEEPVEVAQRLVDELVAGLVARRTAIEAEKAKIRAKADEVAKGSAVDALKKLDPKLLKVLKNNPGLLQSA